jgi:hypothetical protein
MASIWTEWKWHKRQISYSSGTEEILVYSVAIGGKYDEILLYMNFIFLSNTTIYELTHISLCIIEFIGRTMSLHVSAHGAIFRPYINKPYTTELCSYIVLIHNKMHSLKIINASHASSSTWTQNLNHWTGS